VDSKRAFSVSLVLMLAAASCGGNDGVPASEGERPLATVGTAVGVEDAGESVVGQSSDEEAPEVPGSVVPDPEGTAHSSASDELFPPSGPCEALTAVEAGRLLSEFVQRDVSSASLRTLESTAKELHNGTVDSPVCLLLADDLTPAAIIDLLESCDGVTERALSGPWLLSEEAGGLLFVDQKKPTACFEGSGYGLDIALALGLGFDDGDFLEGGSYSLSVAASTWRSAFLNSLSDPEAPRLESSAKTMEQVLDGLSGDQTPAPDTEPAPSAPEITSLTATTYEVDVRGLVTELAVSPDGNWVAYEGQQADANVCFEPLGVEAGDSKCQRVADFGFRSPLAWYPDSKSFIGGDEFQFNLDTDITVVSVDGSLRVIDDDNYSGDTNFDTADVISSATVTDDGRIIGAAYGRGSDFDDQDIVKLNDDGTWTPIATLTEDLAVYSGRFFHSGSNEVVGAAYEFGDTTVAALTFVDLEKGDIQLVPFPTAATGGVAVRHVVAVAGNKILTVKVNLQANSGFNREIPFFEVYDRSTGTFVDVNATARLQPSMATLSPDGQHVAVVYDAANETEATSQTLAVVPADDPNVDDETVRVELANEPNEFPIRSDGVAIPLLWPTDDRIVAVGSGRAAEIRVG